MKWVADITHPKPMHFVIEQQTLRSLIAGQPDQLGFYIYVYENGRAIYDYLQDNLEQAKGFSFRKFHVPVTAWQQVE